MLKVCSYYIYIYIYSFFLVKAANVVNGHVDGVPTCALTFLGLAGK